MGRRDAHLLAGLAAASLCLLAAPVGAGAAPVPSAAGYVTNGPVTAVAMDGSGRTYLGGGFSMVGPRIGHGLKLTSSNDQPASGFPDVNGEIDAVVSDGSVGWFVGGSFTAVGGVARNGLAHINADGSLDPTWNPNPDGIVAALARSGTDLYAGGSFNSIGGQPRNFIAKVSTTGTGAADPTWNPNANNVVNALALSGTDLFAGGSFNLIGGQARNFIAKLSTAGTGDADAAWNPNANSDVLALAVSGSGSDLYAGGQFNGVNSIGGQDRNRIAKLSTAATGAADPTWNPDANGTVFALALLGTDLYAGGFFKGAGSIGGQDRNHIAKLSTTGTGTADPAWNPNANSGVRVLAVAGSDLYAGGFLTSAGSSNVTRNNIARLNADGTLDSTWDPNANGAVRVLALSGTDLYAGGIFSGPGPSIGGQNRNHIAKLSTTGTGDADPTWDPNAIATVFVLALSGTDLYAGGQFSGAASIGGQDRNHIARFATTGTGAADPTWNPDASSDVFALAISGRWLITGGFFDAVGPLSTQGVALFDRSPAVAIAAPADGAAFTQGQSVAASYTCTDPDGSGDIVSCSGPVPSGSPIDTATAGTHTFTVTATDQSGNSASQTVNYTVTAASGGGGGGGGGGATTPANPAPPPAIAPLIPPELSPGNAFVFPRVAIRRTVLTFTFDFPGAGTLDALATTRKLTATTARLRPGPHRVGVGRLHVSAEARGRRTFQLPINRTGRRILARRGKLPIRLTLVYTPTGGQSSRQARKYTIRTGR